MASKREMVLLDVKARIVKLEQWQKQYAGDPRGSGYGPAIEHYTRIAEALEECTHPDDSRWIDTHTDKTWSEGL